MDSSGSSETCYGGGDLASAIILTIIFGVILLLLLRWLYKKYWINRKGTHLVQEDVETGKSAEYAFDNPAFKTETKGGAGSGGTLETKWLSKENGKALEDSLATPMSTKNVSLRGSDFTGLGIELSGGLKEGIYVRKIAPQGPAAGIVNIGDRITSMTIDFRHIVQEDAAAILSYASPYNVRLELAEGKTAMVTPSPKSGHTSMIQAIGGTNSQSDTSSIDRNTKKNLFPGDDNVDSKSSPVQVVQRENEKKSSFTKQVKGLIEEKLQNRSEPVKPRDEPDKEAPSSPSDKSKGLKFGIRVLPPNVNEKIFGKSPTKIQADNENNANLEKNDTDDAKNQEVPPVAQKRKEKKVPETIEVAFERSDAVNSSGIKRDAAGIPQEVPDHMMQAAMSAKENRKSVVQDSGKKGKGKAPSPPPNEETPEKTTDPLNFTDNFVKENRPSANSTPKSERKKSPSDTESQIADRAGDSDGEEESSSHIELSANHITVHQLSDEEEGRRTASLGDLSKIEATKSPSGGRSNTATLERAQSLEITEQPGAVVTPKKRKAPAVDVDIFSEKEPRLSLDMGGGMEALRGRLKSANEWGNLEDAIYSIKDHDEDRSSDTESLNRSDEEQKVDNASNSLMKEIMAVADKFDTETRKIIENEVPKKTMDQLLKEKLEEAQAALSDDSDLVPIVKPAIPKRSSLDTVVRNGNVRDTSREDNVTYTPINVVDTFGTNVPDDVKVSRYPFGSLERPKSDVLKKLMGQKIMLEERETPVNRTTMTILPDEQLIENEPQPISLTLIGGGIESDKTESSQISPVYSSDNMGVNSISISSMEIPAQVENTPLTRIVPDIDNVVTITTDASQPSSIIMIDDECLDFTLQTPPPERTPSPVPQEDVEEEHKIIDENTDSTKTFVTEICVQTPEEKNHTQIKLTDNDSQQDNFPRNSEIKFTTSTYESPGKVAEKRLSQIEQLRSNFEKSQQQSEIPVPVRKSSIPTLKLSPSKIPVFNSKTQDQPPQRQTNNKVSVSVTSIKNSARHPSGK